MTAKLLNARTRIRDLPVSLVLGIISCSLLGYLIGLRILNWNPELVGDFRNIISLLFATSYLYAILGVAGGLGLWLLIWLYSHLFRKNMTGRSFVKSWLTAYVIGITVLFPYLALTRQNVPSGDFDNVLLVIYYLSIVILSLLLYRSVNSRNRKLRTGGFRLTIPKFLLIFACYLIFTFGFDLLTISGSSAAPVVGDKEEIASALAGADNGSRVAIFGWDGAEWSVIEELFARGDMPNLRTLVDGGVSAPFRSLDVLKSPLIWTSIATGKLPEKHGIEDFGSFQFSGMVNTFVDYPDGLGLYSLITRFQRSADLPVTSSLRRCQAFWNIFTDAALTVGVVGWWASWPAENVNGFVVSDRFTYTLFNPRSSALSLTEGQTYPPELLEEIRPFCRLPDSIADEETARFMPHAAGQLHYPKEWSQNEYPDWNPMYQFNLAYTAAESFKNAGLYLYQKYHPSVFAIYFEGIDMISHFFWQYYRPQEFASVDRSDAASFGNVIPEYYRYMDEILGTFLQTLEPGTDVFVLSDHGFGPDTQPRVPFRTGDHRLYGVFVASGPHFRQGLKMDEISVLDVTPTLLYLFGLPGAQDMDGKILEAAITPEYLSDHPPAYIKSYETGPRKSTIVRSVADEQLKEQIRALGYTK